MRKIISIICLIIAGQSLVAQQDTITDLLFDLKKANLNNYYKYELDSVSYCLIKYDTKQKIKDLIFVNQTYGVNKIDTFSNKYLVKYQAIDKNSIKTGGEVSVNKKGGYTNNIHINGTLNDSENGKSYFYSGKDKKLVTVYNMKNGKKYGIDREFHDDGGIRLEEFYDEAMPMGFRWRKSYYKYPENIATIKTCYETYITDTLYYPDGKLKRISTVDFFHKRMGDFKKYYENGNIEEESIFDRGLRQGYTKFYYRNGQLRTEGDFNLGHKMGFYKCYYENGKLKSEEEYLMDLKHGVSKYYDENGKLTLIEKYKEGKRISKEKIK